MSLLDLKTDLKSLKYGQDRPGGGDSRQPYIKTDINTVDTDFNRLRLTRFDDGLVRGGTIGALNSSIVDTLRIGKFFLDAPKGPLFITKQIGLQLSNPQLEVKQQVSLANPLSILRIPLITDIINATRNISNILNNDISPTRIYNSGINTLAQIPVNAFGGHVVRHGLLPTQSEDSKYEAVVRFNNQGGNNRLERLANELQLKSFSLPTIEKRKTSNIPLEGLTQRGSTNKAEFRYKDKKTGIEYTTSDLFDAKGKPKTPEINKKLRNQDYENIGGTSRELGEVEVIATRKTEYKILRDKPQAPLTIIPGGIIPSLSYSGGPGSTYGIGFTNIKRFYLTNNLYNNNQNELNEIAKTTTQNLTRLEITDSEANKASVYADAGLSLLDSRISKFLDTDENSVSIRDYTAVRYSNIQPSLRKYSELINQVEATSSPRYVRISDKRGVGVGKAIQNASPIPANFPSSSYTYENYYGDTVTIIGSNWVGISREKRVGSGRKDEINLTPIFFEKPYDGNTTIKRDDVLIDPDDLKDKSTFNVRDLVKFRIQAVDTDYPGPDSETENMVFRAYLTDLSDDSAAEWSDIKYAGRGDKFYIYTGFTRKISIGFKVAALSADEMKFIYQKLNFLMSNTMPDYNDIALENRMLKNPEASKGLFGGNLMRGPLIRMTVGNWIDSQLGVLNSVNFKVPQDSPWEIALDEPEGGKKQLILPHIVEVTLNFTPIGSETAQQNNIAEKTGFSSHIAQNNTGDIKFQYI